MKLVRAEDATRFENAESCVAYEYETGDLDINIARIEIVGRYPLEGFAVNTQVTELVYVESGRGQVCVDGIVHAINKGDVLSIQKGEKVSWNGTMTLVIACAPTWTPEQYEQHS